MLYVASVLYSNCFDFLYCLEPIPSTLLLSVVLRKGEATLVLFNVVCLLNRSTKSTSFFTALSENTPINTNLNPHKQVL